MEIIRGLHNLRSRHFGCALTIGNFDGVHRGHRAILAQLAEIGAREGLPATLMTFEPHPWEFLPGDSVPSRLTRFKEKMRALETTELQRVLVLRFDDAFSKTSARRFIDHFLVERLGLQHLLVGDDFRFGRGAEGGFETLKKAAARHGFALSRRETYAHAGERVSSTIIREALAQGDLDKAAELLGRPYSILGRVAEGRRLGRTIGFPTANLPLRRRLCPVHGVFAVRVKGAAERVIDGVANVGTRPTVDGTRFVLEVHLFDFSGDLYGREIEVELVARLRGEQRFESVDALKRQLATDAADARAALGAGASA